MKSAAESPSSAAPTSNGCTWPRLRTWVARQLNEVISTEANDGSLAARFRGKQIQAVSRVMPLVVGGTVVTTSGVCLVAWDVASHALLMAWALAVCLGSAVAGRVWHMRLHSKGHIVTASPRSFWALPRHTASYALVWIALPVYVFPLVDHSGQLVIASVTAGVLCVASFLVMPHVIAALTFAVIMTIGSAIGLASTSMSENFKLIVLLAVYLGTLSKIVWINAAVFLAGARAEAEREQQKQLVGLLLRDFEENASDWLWELSSEGRLSHVSARLAQSFARPAKQLLNVDFVELLASMSEQGSAEASVALRRLGAALAHGLAFRNLEVPVLSDGQPRWWSLTAKPLLDVKGRLTGWRGVGSDVTRERTARNELARLANYDTLTGLASRYLFTQQLEGLTQTMDQQARPCSLMLLDLDNFKMVNDSLGHEAGDQLLHLVAQRLRERVQPGDLLARLGGDEFALLSWEVIDPTMVAQRAQSLLDCLNEACVLDETRIEVRTSIGIAIAPTDGDHPQALLKSADLALYAAKAGGRNTWRFFDQQMAQRARERLNLQHELRDALLRGELVLHYQPQVDAATGTVCGFEALVRWRHPQRGLIGPADFIPLAEETGQIIALGAWALRHACEQARHWPGSLRVAVNLSAVQFRSGEVTSMVNQVLGATGLDPSRLELEITESALIEDNASALATLNTLRQRGVRVALDDFGTGYSSLAYLRTFPLDKLKIDGMFVRALGGDTDAREVVRAIISLSHALRLDTTAEGVETHEQLDVLRNLGCHDVQGFLLACPMAADDIPAYLATRSVIGRPAPASKAVPAAEVAASVHMH